MQVESLSLEGLLLIKPPLFSDERGLFFEGYRRSRYVEGGIDVEFLQDNFAFSKKDTLRGLHDQIKPGQAKLISVVEGSIWDVAVDIRPESRTFGKWAAIELNDKNRWQFFIPVGFLHGYCVLSKTACVHYKVSAVYDEAMERTVHWNDPEIGINWPINTPLLSPRDRVAPFLKHYNISKIDAKLGI